MAAEQGQEGPRGAPSPAAVTAHHILLAPRRMCIPGCVSPIFCPRQLRGIRRRVWGQSAPEKTLPGGRIRPEHSSPSPWCSRAGTGLAASTCTECREGAGSTAGQAPCWLSAPFPVPGRRRSRAHCPSASTAHEAPGAGPTAALCPHAQPAPAPCLGRDPQTAAAHADGWGGWRCAGEGGSETARTLCCCRQEPDGARAAGIDTAAGVQGP